MSSLTGGLLLDEDGWRLREIELRGELEIAEAELMAAGVRRDVARKRHEFAVRMIEFPAARKFPAVTPDSPEQDK